MRLFASLLRIAGYAVKIDEDVDYGVGLEKFMREATDSKHVLLIVDENYVVKANTMPGSGVGKENKWISEAYASKPETWLSAVFIQNPGCQLPSWLENHKPKGFNFNSDASKGNFPGPEHIEDVWRWIEGLPADKRYAVSFAALRERAARLEHVNIKTDQARFTKPELKGSVSFTHQSNQYFHVGQGIYQFDIKFDEPPPSIIRVYNFGVKALGQLPDFHIEPLDYKDYLEEERTISLKVKDKAVLLNLNGIFCVITIDKIINKDIKERQKGVVEFSYEILHGNNS